MSEKIEPEEKTKEKKAEDINEEDGVEQVSTVFALRNNTSEEEKTSSLWLITFTDIMALMLTFFVLLYSMSTPSEQKWVEMTATLNKGLSKFYSPKWYGGAQETISIEKIDSRKALDLKYLEALVDELIKRDEGLKNTVLLQEKDRLIVSLPSNLLFDQGETEVTVDGQKALFALGGIFSNIRNRIEVAGHADPQPISDKNPEISSNWELSLMRAINVADVLRNVGYGRPIVKRGLSSSRYFELSDDLSQEERLNLSRRVDLIIMQDDGSQRFFMELDSSG